MVLVTMTNGPKTSLRAETIVSKSLDTSFIQKQASAKDNEDVEKMHP